jgi:hypothetical protein
MRSVVLSAVLCAGGLAAGTIDTPTVNFDLITGAGTNPTTFVNGNLAQFDPALGTLTGITVFMDATVIMNLHASIVGAGQTSIFADFEEGATLANLPGLAEFDTFLEFEQAHFGCNGQGSDEFTSCSVDQQFSSGISVLPGMALAPIPNMNAYVGTGTVPFELASWTGITNVASIPAGGGLQFNSTEITGDLWLEYTFTPAAASTPEPGTTALLGGGLLLLGLSRVKKRRQAK